MTPQSLKPCDTNEIDSTIFLSKPWIGNNQILIDIADSIDALITPVPKSGTGVFDPQAIWWIPIKAWVYNDDNGDGGITEAQVENSIRRLNEYFAGTVNNTGNSQGQIDILSLSTATVLN